MTVSKYQMDQCKGRYTKEKKYIKLPVQYAYFREKRCENEALRDELCEVCLEKKKTFECHPSVLDVLNNVLTFTS